MIDIQKINPFVSIILFCFWANYKSVAQIDISLIGNWIQSVPATDITEAGRDFTGSFLSATNQVLVEVFRVQGNKPFDWRVDVGKSDVDWVAGLQLYVRRTGNGNAQNGNSFISGGTTFQLLTNTYQSFFNGSRSYSDIPIQYQLTGVSVLIPAKIYATTVIYTLTEL